MRHYPINFRLDVEYRSVSVQHLPAIVDELSCRKNAFFEASLITKKGFAFFFSARFWIATSLDVKTDGKDQAISDRGVGERVSQRDEIDCCQLLVSTFLLDGVRTHPSLDVANVVRSLRLKIPRFDQKSICSDG